jgi:glycosyltransferase involved in cell wall biosynthesis
MNLLNKLQASESCELCKPDNFCIDHRIRVAALCDSPTVITGFGNVAREVLTMLHNTGRYTIDIVGINYDGSFHTLPFRIKPAVNALIPDGAYREVYGRQVFLDMVSDGRYDLVWVLQDTFIVEALGNKLVELNAMLPPDQKFRFIHYFPIDATPKKSWIDGAVLTAHHPVAYTKYGYDEVMKLYHVGADTQLTPEEQERNRADYARLAEKLNIIYHGVNLKDFYPIEDAHVIAEWRGKSWGPHKDKFVFMSVNWNQPRKDLFRTLQAFKMLLDRRRAKGKDDVYLYLHCNIYDTDLNLLDMTKQLRLTEGNEWAFPDPKVFQASRGYPVEILNALYAASDAIVTTTLGEGWGLSITEAMATKRLIIAPDNTSIPEILGKTDKGGAERGLLYKSGLEWFVQHQDNSRARPLADVASLVDAMEWAVDHREEKRAIEERAYEWVKTLAWDGALIGQKWQALFEAAYEGVVIDRALAIDQELARELKASKLNRNDQCPVCAPKKFKHCRHGHL